MSSTSRLLPRSRPHLVGTSVLLASLLVVGVLAAVFRLAMHGAVQPATAFAFGGVIVLGEALRITLPGGRDNAPLAATAALGYALTPQLCDHAAEWGPVQVVVVVAIAAAVGSVPQAMVGRPPSVGYLVRRVGVAGAVAWLLRSVLDITADRSTGSGLLLLLSAMACLALMLDSALAALFATSSAEYAPGPLSAHPEFADPAAHFGVAPLPAFGSATAEPQEPNPERVSVSRVLHRFFANWLEECSATARVCPAVAALSVAVALAAGPLGLWVLPIAAAPVLVMQRALRRYAAIRATYQQTIRALSRVTDLAGYTDPGHARRVCRLALAIGRDLDLTEPELLDLEYAALLHDIGQLSLADPLPGGATVLATPWVAAEVAVRGAEVVRQTGVLDRVARVLEAQYQPYQGSAGVAVGVSVAEASAASAGPAGPGGAGGEGVDGRDGSSGPGGDSRVGSSGPSGGGDVREGGGRESGGREGGVRERGAGADAERPVEPGAELRAAAILRVANDFEDLRNAGPGVGPSAQRDALARIRLGLGTRYDPRAVAALARRLRLD
jgi:hypothetical protein